MPDLTYSTALSAAIFLSSSWVRTGADWALREKILVGARRLREGVRKKRREEEGGERKDKEAMVGGGGRGIGK
jgi:hypothetical protein